MSPDALTLVITAERGGRNGSLESGRCPCRHWRTTRLPLSVCCFPPGTSQWNTAAHRVFSFISSNWRGEPLRDDETMGNLMARTTAKGLTVPCRRDRRKYPTGRKVTDEAPRRVNLERHTFHGEWNDTIRPQSR